MIPNKDAGYHPLHTEEPPARLHTGNAEPSLFSPRYPALRKLVVMIDSELVGTTSAPTDAHRLLLWQLGNPNIRFYGYPGCMDYLPHRDGKTLIPYSAVLNAHDDDIRASLTAGMLGVDFFITERERLLRERRWLKEVNCHYPPAEAPCHGPAGAVALIGLYLRAQGDFSVPGEPSQESRPQARARLYQLGALAAVPTLATWDSLTFHCGDDSITSATGALVRSVQDRVREALLHRDLMHVALHRTDDHANQAEAFGRLDSFLLFLMAALDAAARIAHLTLGAKVGVDVIGKARHAAWQQGKWLKVLQQHFTALSALVAPGSHGERVMTLLRHLRNTIHSESLMTSAGCATLSWGEAHPLLALSAELREALDAVVDLDRVPGQGDLVRPGELVEHLFLHVVTLLDDLLRNTPVDDHDDVARRIGEGTGSGYRYPEFLRLHFGLEPRRPHDGGREDPGPLT